MSIPPRLVLETSFYANDLAAAEQFYGDVLGLDVMLRTEGTHVTFRCGSGAGAVHVFDLDTDGSGPVERFQNETLRPILKLLNPTILRLDPEDYSAVLHSARM